ncbi:PREDICTED: Fanconi anemia group J protein homolog isoform X2 [Vollenhovia emeryi]|uniref:Fanconi anemia group J protein homolog isoform X2 n=1 Tax=Vollenhovia emeryi TaxID=411798 RepID=UPI0005F4DCB1|nr:PREDICTED: Fanconi anemia group J protein homolog isoform X2 [Vollenhovia emeryi]
MIVICAIVAVIGLLVCALLRTRLDERHEDPSMKRNPRLSLRRGSQCEARGSVNDPVEISDDESLDLPPNIQSSKNVIGHGAADVSSSVVDAAGCNSKHVHDISDDLSSDDDVIVEDAPDNASNKSLTMFNWNKSVFATDVLYQDIFPKSSGSRYTDSPSKRQRLMNNPPRSVRSSSSDDDESTSLYISKKDDSPPKVGIQHEMLIAGIRVKLPVKPYPCQIAVMNSLIQGCTKEQNCLLESPTGSGKTLALLCGALAWQEQYREEICREKGDGSSTEKCDEDDSFNDNFFLNSSQYFDEEMYNKILHEDRPRKVPKIFYGTRTHKQIEQVVRELKKTAYRHKRMTILSSRRHTCIQETDRNKNELCNELLDPLKGKKCPYYNEHSKRKATIFNTMNTPWDIEDLVSVGNHVGACPYFGARSLMAEADIIFCPYNYVLDPDIRESMQISLRDNIVILDEAHNVEDMCREAASVNLRDDEMTHAAKECQHLHLLYENRDPHTYDTIQRYLTDIAKFLKNIAVEEKSYENGMMSKSWLGSEFRELLHVYDVGCSRFPDFLAASGTAIQDFGKNMKEEIRREKIIPTISRDTKKILEYLCFAMQMISSDNFANDYRIYVVETIELTKKAMTEAVSATSKEKVRTMKLICMNPAIIFAPIARLVRSVIVASGTLTPTASFQSELGTRFPHIVNPNHIIPEDQVYVRCIPRGPSGKSLRATFDKVNSWEFQDELGNLILRVCDAVPYGVLCFFPSYKTMNTIHERWKNTEVWRKLADLKRIFVESSKELDLTEYRRVIEESSSKSFRTACGAILFAVYRGKVAEGTDFSDNEARCVLAVSNILTFYLHMLAHMYLHMHICMYIA